MWAVCTNAEIYVLDMGEPINIDHLARDLIKLSGYIPDQDIKIVYTGVRPGEKLFEELFSKDEDFEKTKNERIFIAKSNNDILLEEDLEALIKQINKIIIEYDYNEMKNLFKQYIPDSNVIFSEII